VLDAPQDVTEEKPSDEWHLHIPGKDAQSFASEKEWSESYDELCAKVMAAKISPADKLAKIDSLREANKLSFKKMTMENRLVHTQGYAKRKDELGL
jgi:hypothetical protein